MSSIWVESLGRNFERSLDLLEAAIRDCTDELWETSMWVVPARDANAELVGPDGTLVNDPAARHALVQRHSTPWSIAWHALEVLDYDLAGEFVPWAPPPPFTGKAHWRDLTTLPSAWSRSEVLMYVDYCRQRVQDTLSDMTDEKAATFLPPAHRNHGRPFAWELAGLPLHIVEHAAQIRQFITSAGVAPGIDA
jgi:DinB superfamily